MFYRLSMPYCAIFSLLWKPVFTLFLIIPPPLLSSPSCCANPYPLKAPGTTTGCAVLRVLVMYHMYRPSTLGCRSAAVISFGLPPVYGITICYCSYPSSKDNVSFIWFLMFKFIYAIYPPFSTNYLLVCNKELDAWIMCYTSVNTLSSSKFINANFGLRFSPTGESLIFLSCMSLHNSKWYTL